MNELCFAGISFFVALLAGRLLIPSIVFVSIKRRLFDQPNSRKLHTRQISRLGGISFLPSAIIASCVALLAMDYAYPDTVSSLMFQYMANTCLFVIGFMIIFLTGIIDDLSGMSYRYKFLLQSITAFIVVTPLLHMKTLDGILGIYALPIYISIPITMAIIVLIINAYNLIDGVDGLCSGLSIVTITSLGIALMHVDNILLVILASGMVGVLSIFFFYNAFGHKLKIFMGDTGSLVLGFVISYMAFQYLNLSYQNGTPEHSFAIVAGCLFVPVFDATRLFVYRMMRGNSPFMPDKNHIHHKFIALGFTHIQTTMSIITMQIVYILTNVILSKFLNINVIILIDLCMGMGINATLNFYVNRKKSVRAQRMAKYHSSRGR